LGTYGWFGDVFNDRQNKLYEGKAWLDENLQIRAGREYNTARILGHGQTPGPKKVIHSAHNETARRRVTSEIHRHKLQCKDLFSSDHFTQLLPNIVNQLPQIDVVTKITSILFIYLSNKI
jgi:hypothetical protein